MGCLQLSPSKRELENYHLKNYFLTSSVDVSPIASVIAVGTSSGKIFVVNVATLKTESVIEPQKGFGPVRVVRFNCDGQLIVTGHDTGVMEVSVTPSVTASIISSVTVGLTTSVNTSVTTSV